MIYNLWGGLIIIGRTQLFAYNIIIVLRFQKFILWIGDNLIDFHRASYIIIQSIGFRIIDETAFAVFSRMKETISSALLLFLLSPSFITF